MLRRISQTSKTRFISFVFVLAFVAVGLTASLHTHKADTKAPEHCGLCQVGHQIRTGSTPLLQKTILPTLREITLEQVQTIPCSFLSSSANLSRAPPPA